MRMKEEDFTDVVDANLTAAYRVAKRAAAKMVRARSGRMIFVSSVVGLLGSAGPGQLRAPASPAWSGLARVDRPRARQPRHHRERRRARLRRHRHDRGAAGEAAEGDPGAGAARPVRLGGGDRRRRALPRRATRPATSPGRSSRSTADWGWGTDGHSRGQEDPGHRRADRGVDRLRDGAARAGAGRHRRPVQLRAGPVAVPADRQAAAAGGRRRRARRHRHRAPVDAGRPAARAGRRRPRRRRPLDRLRAAGGDGRRLPRGRRGSTPRRRSRCRPGRCASLTQACRPLFGETVLGRRAHLRRHRRLAGLRLDGRGQGGAGVDVAATSRASSAPRACASTSSPPARCAAWR